MQLILASSSRYRKDMLMRLGLPFSTATPDVDETPAAGEPPAQLALRLARAKAMAIAAAQPGALVIGADQVATGDDGLSVGKPGHHEAAVIQLRRLSGRCITFHSALCVTDGRRCLLENIPTICQFRPLDEASIEHYLQRERPYDTAGSAKAEGLGIALMDRMQSDDPTAIIGLPLIALARMLREFGLDPLLAHATDLAVPA